MLINSFKTLSSGDNENINKINAPNNAIIQYKLILIFLIFNEGKNNNDNIINITVIDEIIIVGIISLIFSPHTKISLLEMNNKYFFIL